MRLLALLPALLATGCALDLQKDEAGQSLQNQCSSNSDCRSGECWQGACVAHEGALSSVLLEVAAPKSVLGVGGTRYLQTLSGLSRSSEGKTIDLQLNTIVRGFVIGTDKACADGSRSFAVDVTFTPREEAYGLSVVNYLGTTERVTAPSCGAVLEGLTDVEQFTVPVPTGAYDVYVKSAAANATTDPPKCAIVPQLFRKVSFSSGGATCLKLAWSPPQKLDVIIPWDAGTTGEDSLDGWAIEVVHPLTGHVLSTREVLSADDRKITSAGPGYERAVSFTPVVGETPGNELVRLTPPAGVIAPVVQAARSGLQVASTEAVFPSVGPFPAPVTIKGSVFEKDDGDSAQNGVPGRLSLTASALQGIRAGIFASYSTSVVVGDDGSFSADVMPGTFRARVVPAIGLSLAATESTIDVQCASDIQNPGFCLPRKTGQRPPSQAGRRFEVPRAATLTGSIVDSIDGSRVSQVTVNAQPASVGARTCASDADGTKCTAAPLGVLDVALGEDAFVPRPVSTLAPSGKFTLPGLDCGKCEGDSGALFDVFAFPPDSSRPRMGGPSRRHRGHRSRSGPGHFVATHHPQRRGADPSGDRRAPPGRERSPPGLRLSRRTGESDPGSQRRTDMYGRGIRTQRGRIAPLHPLGPPSGRNPSRSRRHLRARVALHRAGEVSMLRRVVKASPLQPRTCPFNGAGPWCRSVIVYPS